MAVTADEILVGVGTSAREYEQEKRNVEVEARSRVGAVMRGRLGAYADALKKLDEAQAAGEVDQTNLIISVLNLQEIARGIAQEQSPAIRPKRVGITLADLSSSTTHPLEETAERFDVFQHGEPVMYAPDFDGTHAAIIDEKPELRYFPAARYPRPNSRYIGTAPHPDVKMHLPVRNLHGVGLEVGSSEVLISCQPSSSYWSMIVGTEAIASHLDSLRPKRMHDRCGHLTTNENRIRVAKTQAHQLVGLGVALDTEPIDAAADAAQQLTWKMADERERIKRRWGLPW